MTPIFRPPLTGSRPPTGRRLTFARNRLALAGVLAAVLVMAGCTVVPVFAPPTSGRAPAQPPVSGAAWTPCPNAAKDLVGRTPPNMTYDCATITVPQDWHAAGGSGATANPSGGPTFQIALLRARSTQQRNRIGSLVINPGGPGASGIDTAVYLSFGPAFSGLPDEVTRQFDIVGFDPRGVSRSSPIKCISDANLDANFGYEPDPKSQAAFDGLVALNQTIGNGCANKYGDGLRLYATEQAARDMDAVRNAVGDQKLTYLGYSYGSLLGATYAQLFPHNVRALVLDGAVDPRQDLVSSSESQAQGFERAFSNFAAWCAKTPAKCPIAPDARAAVTTMMDKARVSPVTGSDGRPATAGWVLYAVISSLYTQTAWEELAKAISDLEHGNPTGVFKLADAYAQRGPDGHYSNLSDANLAVNCTDASTKPSVQQIRDLQSQWRAKYPLFGAPLAVGMLSCAEWPGQRDPYPTGTAAGAPPILVVGTTGDPATPYEQTARLANMLGVGQVLTWEGEGHTAYPQTPCITTNVDAYLINLTVPPAGKRCPAR